MKTKTFLLLVFSLFLSLAVIMGCGKSKDESSKKKTDDTEETSEKKKERTDDKESSRRSSDEALLYFCEDYVNGKEIGKSDVFTPGYLTVMVDLRPAKKTIGTGKVDLRLTKIKDEYGDPISDEIIETIPFNVEPDWDYTYFQDKEKLGFREPGTYKVTLMKTDGTPICSGQVKVIPKNK